MIRKLTEGDRSVLMEFVCKNPAYNLFIIGDVENDGFDAEFQEVWGQFEEQRLIAVMLRYYNSYLPYAEGPYDAQGFADLIRANKDAEVVSGILEVTRPLIKELNPVKKREFYFAELKEYGADQDREGCGWDDEVREAGLKDIDPVMDLLGIIEEFRHSTTMRASRIRAIESGTGRTYFIMKDGKVAATASSAAENSYSAMIVAVATHPQYRGQGLATSVVGRLCKDLLSEGRTMCLFYDNPAAGSIYRRIGFQEIGKWSNLYIK